MQVRKLPCSCRSPLPDSNLLAPVLRSEQLSHLLPAFLSTEVTNVPRSRPKVKSGIKAGSRHATSVVSAIRSSSPRRRHDRHSTLLRQDSFDKTIPEEQIPKFPASTRARFIDQATKAGLLRQSKAVAQDQEYVLHRVRVAFAKMAAEDWNLVLSQMALTLDEIDSKMSDNTLLQSNALAWRRLLCSWRVSLVDYATRLEEVKSKLQSPANDPSRVADPPISGSDDKGSLGYRLKTNSSSIDEEQHLLQLYQILLGGLHKIEQRVDRSFQAIMSSMSILESERAITQGAAITRLTELAFFFIPLSFAATFFSMQIRVSPIIMSVLLVEQRLRLSGI